MRRQIWVQDQAFHLEERLGTNQGVTPEGFLLCENVPIARTGMMLYGAGEIHVNGEFLDADENGIIRVTRDEDEVFHPRALSSFEGKSVTDDHPPEGVDPTNFRDFEIGTTHNVRRGDGAYSDCIVADLLIKDKNAIKAVQDGKREVSCGYDADYEQSEPGRAKQFKIVGNHVALVDRGRCGPRCSIGDKAMATRDKKPSVLDRIRAALKGHTADSLTKDQVAKFVADAEKADKEDDDDKSTKDAIAGFQKTIDALPGMIAAAVKDAMGTRDADEEDEDEDDMTEDADKEDEDGDNQEMGNKVKIKDRDTVTDKNKTVDAATMRDVMQAVRSHAEVLAPGHKLHMPTTDAKLTRLSFSDSMCNCKRKALDVAYRTEDGRKAIEPFLAGRTADFARMNAKTIDTIFTGAAIARGMVNNDAAGRGLRAGVTRDDFGAAPITIDSLNKRHEEFWAKKA